MSEPFSDELLSAYLDGELLGEERERVEEWLAASADHRRLLDDLKAIRRELQALPRQTLDAGFADRVLVAIHQRTSEPNSPPSSNEAPPPSAQQGSPIPAEPVNLAKKDLGMPAWRWFAAGVAATLLAMIAGINAAPQTMTQIGRVAQVRQSIEPGEGAVGAARKNPSPGIAATPTVPPGESVPTPDLAQRDSADASKQVEVRAFSRAMNKDAAKLPTDADRQPKENAPAPPGPPKAESPPLPAPSVVADGAPAAPPAGLESADEDFADRPGSRANAAKKSRAGGFANGRLPATSDDVVELPVTSEQADRALAFYSQAATRQTAQRLKNLERVENVAEATADEYAAGKALEQQKEQDVFLKGTASARTLMKLMDVAGDGVQIAAVEVTGNEAEVAALLDTLGVSEARKLATYSQVLRARGAGGVVAMQANGQKAGGEGVESIPKAAALAEPGVESPAKPVAKADAVEKKVAKAEEEKGVAGPGGGSEARDKFRGNSPAVRMRSLAGSGAAGREPASLSGAAEQSAQPQLRVRLVIVPAAADPIGPTIELEPQE
jgi:anti-sigma factor RsiW